MILLSFCVQFKSNKKNKKKAVITSFAPKKIECECKGGKIKQPAKKESTPQEKGQAEHKEFARLINNDIRDGGVKSKVLDSLEKRFKCTFIAAEVGVWGWAVIKSKESFYSGRMDAIAFRQHRKEVLIVDWKSIDKQGVPRLSTWWNDVGHFKDPLYQCLVYRQLLAQHLKSNAVDVLVGIMIVPYHQSNPLKPMPGLCVDFTKMEEQGLLSGLKKYRWCSSDSEVVHIINFPECKLFKKLQILNEFMCVDESTELLKDGTLLKDVISDDATIGVLRKELGLLSLKVTNEVEKDGGGEKRRVGKGGDEEGRGRGRGGKERAGGSGGGKGGRERKR